MFLGWFDPEKKKPARLKLAEAIARHIAKFGAAPELCLVNPADADELAADPKAPAIALRIVEFLPRSTFYVGVDDVPAADLPEAA